MSRVFFFKRKTAYEMRISDWSSDVCSSDLVGSRVEQRAKADDAFGVMEVHPQHRHVGGPGNLPEAGLPALHPLARPLRRQSVPEPVAAVDQRREIVRAACMESVCPYVDISVVSVSLTKNIANIIIIK